MMKHFFNNFEFSWFILHETLAQTCQGACRFADPVVHYAQLQLRLPFG